MSILRGDCWRAMKQRDSELASQQVSELAKSGVSGVSGACGVRRWLVAEMGRKGGFCVEKSRERAKKRLKTGSVVYLIVTCMPVKLCRFNVSADRDAFWERRGVGYVFGVFAVEMVDVSGVGSRTLVRAIADMAGRWRG